MKARFQLLICQNWSRINSALSLEKSGFVKIQETSSSLQFERSCIYLAMMAMVQPLVFCVAEDWITSMR